VQVRREHGVLGDNRIRLYLESEDVILTSFRVGHGSYDREQQADFAGGHGGAQKYNKRGGNVNCAVVKSQSGGRRKRHASEEELLWEMAAGLRGKLGTTSRNRISPDLTKTNPRGGGCGDRRREGQKINVQLIS